MSTEEQARDSFVEESYTTATVVARFVTPDFVKYIGLNRVRNQPSSDDAYELTLAVDGDTPAEATAKLTELRRHLAAKLLTGLDA